MQLSPLREPSPATDLPVAPEQVEGALRAFSSALRSFRLYAGQSPTLDRFLQGAHDRFLALWNHVPLLRLEVDERSICWNGHRVFPAGDSGSDLAFLFYKDGIREIVLLPGFEAELRALLLVLVRANQVREEEDDLITLLWEEEFHCFHYQYVEAGGEGVDLGGGSEPATPVDPRAVRQSVQQSTAAIRPEDFQETLYFLDSAELERLEAEIRRDASRDLWEGILTALFDRLEDGSAERRRRIVEILNDLLPSLLAAGEFRHAATLLSEVAELAARPELFPAAVLKGVRALFARVGSPETISQLLEMVEAEPDLLRDGSFAVFLEFFPPESLAALARASLTIARPDLRRRFDSVVQRLARHNRPEVLSLLGDAEPQMVVAAARWAGEVGIGAAAPILVERLAHPCHEVRLAAVEALVALRASTSGDALPTLLEDPQREVRIAAARSLASLGITSAREALESVLASRRLRSAERRERIAFYEAYGQLGGVDAIALLQRTLNARGWLRRGEDSETRACAALGLARIRHPSATAALQTAANDADPVVRSAVARALRGEEAR
jgi:HEAT repeat protein